MRSSHIPMPVEEFHLLPHKLGWKHEYWDGQAHISPRDQSVRCRVPAVGREVPCTCEIRDLEPGDEAALVSLFLSSFSDTIEYCDWEAAAIERSARESVARFLGSTRGPRFSASRVAAEPGAGRLVGAALICEVTPARALLDLLMVEPGSQRTGIATALVATACCELARLGFTELESRYHLGNEASRAWHRRFGFVDEPDLFLAQAMCRHLEHELWRRRQLSETGGEGSLSLEAELQSWRQLREGLEALAMRERVVVSAPVLPAHAEPDGAGAGVARTSGRLTS